MLVHKSEELDSMYEKEFESRITRLETINENINTTLLELKSDLKTLRTEITSEIKSLRSESIVQTRWILGFIFLILGSPIFSALITKLSAWAHP